MIYIAITISLSAYPLSSPKKWAGLGRGGNKPFPIDFFNRGWL
jgi:hypothetical protein